MYEPLTITQQKVLRVVTNYIEQNKIPPTLRELQDLLNVSSNQAVINHLDALEKKGYLSREDKTARSIRLNENLLEPLGNNPFIKALTKAKRINSKTKLQGKKVYVPYTQTGIASIEPISWNFNGEDYGR